MGFTGMFSVETILKIIGFGVKVGEIEQLKKYAELPNLMNHIIYMQSP